jgi:hypothetical protein
MHYWGDEWFEKYGDDLYEAGAWIATELYRRTRCHLIYKEKYGTLRYEYIIAPGGSVVSYRYPICSPFITRTPYGNYRKILWAWNTSWIYRKWVQFGNKVLKQLIIHAATIKYPHLFIELTDDIDLDEL